MNFILKKLVALLITVVITLAACQTAKNDLVGIWSGSDILQFKDDGTFAGAELSSLLEEAPVDHGEYELIGTTLSFHSSENSDLCPGFNGSYNIAYRGGLATVHLA
jgi:hypothetical protein